MNVLLTGASGQVGKYLVHTCPDKVNLLALDKHALDISNRDNIKEIFNQFEPNLVINAAAYTSVENAEAEKELAYQINRNGVANIALACKTNNIRLIHYSTDYVFDGNNSSPYTIQDIPNPINVYGQSKLEGEKKALEINCDKTLIIRTSWVYSNHGDNFVKTMLKLMNENESIEIITDQTGTPTWAKSIAKITWRFVIQPELNGVFNFSDSGSTTWFEFAKEIQSIATKYNILNNATKIIPITTEDYSSNVKRPLYSVLDCNKTWELLNVKPDDWRTSLGKMLQNYNQ